MNKQVYPFIMAASNKNYGIIYLRSEQTIQKTLGYLSSFATILKGGKINAGDRTFNIASLPHIMSDCFLPGPYSPRTPLDPNYKFKLDRIFLEKIKLYESGGVRGGQIMAAQKTYANTQFDFLYKLGKGALVNMYGTFDCKAVSIIDIEKGKYNLLEFNTVDRNLTTDDISKIKKYTISTAY